MKHQERDSCSIFSALCDLHFVLSFLDSAVVVRTPQPGGKAGAPETVKHANTLWGGDSAFCSSRVFVVSRYSLSVLVRCAMNSWAHAVLPQPLLGHQEQARVPGPDAFNYRVSYVILCWLPASTCQQENPILQRENPQEKDAIVDYSTFQMCLTYLSLQCLNYQLHHEIQGLVTVELTLENTFNMLVHLECGTLVYINFCIYLYLKFSLGNFFLTFLSSPSSPLSSPPPLSSPSSVPQCWQSVRPRALLIINSTTEGQPQHSNCSILPFLGQIQAFFLCLLKSGVHHQAQGSHSPANAVMFVHVFLL